MLVRSHPEPYGKFQASLGYKVSYYLRVSIAVIKYHSHKQHGDERAYFILQLVVHHLNKVGQEGTPGKN